MTNPIWRGVCGAAQNAGGRACDGQGINDVGAGAADAPSVGTVGAQRVVAGGVWVAARTYAEYAHVVAAGVAEVTSTIFHRLTDTTTRQDGTSQLQQN